MRVEDAKPEGAIECPQWLPASRAWKSCMTAKRIIQAAVCSLLLVAACAGCGSTRRLTYHGAALAGSDLLVIAERSSYGGGWMTAMHNDDVEQYVLRYAISSQGCVPKPRSVSRLPSPRRIDTGQQFIVAPHGDWIVRLIEIDTVRNEDRPSYKSARIDVLQINHVTGSWETRHTWITRKPFLLSRSGRLLVISDPKVRAYDVETLSTVHVDGLAELFSAVFEEPALGAYAHQEAGSDRFGRHLGLTDDFDYVAVDGGKIYDRANRQARDFNTRAKGAVVMEARKAGNEWLFLWRRSAQPAAEPIMESWFVADEQGQVRHVMAPVGSNELPSSRELSHVWNSDSQQLLFFEGGLSLEAGSRRFRLWSYGRDADIFCDNAINVRTDLRVKADRRKPAVHD